MKRSDVHGDHARHLLQHREHFAQVDRLAKRALLERKLSAQLLLRIGEHLLRNVSRIDFERCGYAKQSGLVRLDLQRHERIAGTAHRADEVRVKLAALEDFSAAWTSDRDKHAALLAEPR